MKRYKHLNIFERETLSQLLLRGGSLTDIVKIMGRDKSTLSREISRGQLGRAGYRVLTAQFFIEQNKHLARRPKKILNNPLLESDVHKYLRR